MNYRLLFASAFLMAGVARSQDAFYPLAVGTRWAWQQYWSTTSALQEAVQDTLMGNGKRYARISPPILALAERFERQEGSRVYRYSTATQQEWLLFDFSASSGDTVNHSPLIILAGIKLDTLFGKTRKMWEFGIDYIPQAIDDEEIYTITDSIGITDFGNAYVAMRVIGAKVGSQTFGTLTSVPLIAPPIAHTFELLPSYPNPFNGQANIRFELRERAFVTVIIRDLVGREVQRIFSNNLSAGMHQFTWNASTVSSGTYFCDFAAQEEHRMIKLVLIK